MAEHECKVYIKASLTSPFRSPLDILNLESLHKPVERNLIGGFHSEKNKTETCLAHHAVICGRQTSEAHVAVDADFLVETALDHLIAEYLHEPSDGEGSGIVHDLFHAVLFDKILDLIHNIVGITCTVGGIERCPTAESAFRMPAVTSGHYVCAGSPAEVAVLLCIEFPLAEISVDPGRRLQVMVELKTSGVPYGAIATTIPYARLVFFHISIGCDKVHQKEIPITAGQDEIDGAVLHRLFRHRGNMVTDKDILR